MPFFVALERDHGSLINGLRAQQSARNSAASAPSIFTSLRTGLGSLIDAMAALLPAGTVRLQQPVSTIARDSSGWTVTSAAGTESYDAILLATAAHMTRKLLLPTDYELSELHNIAASSAALVALAYSTKISLPETFGFLVQHPQSGFHPALLAGTFSHIKYPHTTPSSGMLLRVFFGGPHIADVEKMDDSAIVHLAQQQVRHLFPEMPVADLTITQRWPNSLPQYELGHEDRVLQIESRVSSLPGLHLLGNSYRGVGLPDMVRRAREQARAVVA
jgi:protoporphyrinogen/coproporphyrinogen III oxidase